MGIQINNYKYKESPFQLDNYINPITNYDLKYYSEDNLINDNKYKNKDENDINIICPICLNILNNPKCCSSKTNSHSFCKECIDINLKKNNKCPMCQQKFEYKTNSLINNVLYKLKFKCCFEKNGCKQIINYLDYFNHAKNCNYKIYYYECHINKYNLNNLQYEECKYRADYKEMEKHFKNHEMEKVKCIFCHKSYLRINSQEHFEKNCEIETVDYKNGYKFIRYKNDKFGIYNFMNGDKLIGSFYGYGIYYYVNGEKYMGEMKNKSREGFGLYYYLNGDIYEGNWEYHYINGFGIKYYSNGEKYEGEWKYNKRDGFGTYFYLNGVISKGFWKDDKKLS